MADFSDLDRLFECPEWVTEDPDRALHAVKLVRWQQESSHLPLSMSQLVRISMALKGSMRVHIAGRRAYGEPGGFANAGAELAYEEHLLKILNSIDEVLHKNQPHGPELTEKSKVFRAVGKVLASVPDSEERVRLQRAFADTFDAQGV